MPTSWYETIPTILDKVRIENPTSILDIGIGFGKYGVLLREALDIPFKRYEKKDWQTKIDGIEAFEGYKNPIHEYIYDKIYYNTMENVLPTLDHYDVIMMIDVLEHFEKDEGRKILEKLLPHANKAIIISTPIYPAHQEEYNGNTYEAHKSKWTIVDFVQYKMDYALQKIGNNQALIVKIYPNKMILRQNEEQLAADRFFLHGITTEKISPHADKLHIAYVMPHKYLTGGIKMLIEQIRWLKTRGHEVDTYLKSDTDSKSALPEWNKVDVDRDIVIPSQESFKNVIRNYDVIVAGFFQQIPELLQCDAPVLYWEQGYEWLFGDLKGSPLAPQIHQQMDSFYSLPFVVTVASNFISEIFKNRFGRVPIVVPNGIDVERYYPGPHADENLVLLVGNPALEFKGFHVALNALELAWNNGAKFTVCWIGQVPINIRGIHFPIRYVTDPGQDQLPDLYRQADLFLFTSWYEGFGLPPLEAMASGVPVICTECGGPGMYLKPNENALTAQPGDIPTLAAEIAQLLENEGLRKTLADNGRKTALTFSAENSCLKLERVLYHIKEHGIQAPTKIEI